MLSVKVRAKVNAKLSSEIKKIEQASYENDYASISLLEDDSRISVIKTAISLKRQLRPSHVIVCGIGGSSLGAKAIQEALKPRAPISYADTTDPDHLLRVINRMQNVLRQGHNVILCVVSKSGKTTETIANFEILYNVLKKHRKNAHEYIIGITDKDSPLWNKFVSMNISLLDVPKKVGGRFSVFSAAGLFPLGMIGVDIDKLIKGARKAKLELSAKTASHAYEATKKGYKCWDHFLFSKDLEGLGKWCRQLIAESLGKKDKTPMPAVSIGTNDLHSVAQLTLANQKSTYTSFVYCHFLHEQRVPDYPKFEDLGDVGGKTLNDIMRVIYDSVLATYKKKRKPFTSAVIVKNEESFGEYMQHKMYETIMMAKLLNVNAFNQPNVEDYKKEIRKRL